jgi:hypothetical protein
MFAEDLTTFLQPGDFAIAATYKPGGTGAGSAVNVIFDAPWQEQLGVSAKNPTVTGRAADFATFTTADTLTINSTIYRIVDSNPLDDGALVRLQLEDQT